MSPEIVAALIGLAGSAIGGLATHFLPTLPLFHRLSSKTRHHSVVGDWDSSWGPLPSGPIKHTEFLRIEKQRGQQVEGYFEKDDLPNRRWHVEGRYDGLFLMLFYWPAEDSKDRDFLSHGCYFLTRKADGSFEGYSSGYGEGDDPDDKAEGISSDFHVLRRKK